VGDGQVLDEAAPPVVVVEEDVPEATSPDSSSATMVVLLDGRASLADQTDRSQAMAGVALDAFYARGDRLQVTNIGAHELLAGCEAPSGAVSNRRSAPTRP
jgi:hypothetical protein